MATQTDPSAEPRTRLSRDRVLRAAIALADEGGIESLTMRKLGRELRVEAMSLYNHVANKDDILDGMVDVVFGEIGPPATGAGSPPTGSGTSASTRRAGAICARRCAPGPRARR